jgi:protoporphyrinogen oxidase
MTGLVAAYRLGQAGCLCDVYERWPGLGGQVATIDVGDAVLERYYHHLFTSDVHIAALYEELGMPDAVEWLPSTVAMFVGGETHPFTTPIDLLRFKPLSIRARIRMGVRALRLNRADDPEPFERETARSWIVREMGNAAWETIWGPLLRGKFGARAEEISMVWLWSKLRVRRQVGGKEARKELLGYPRGSWQPLLDRLVAAIESAGGRVMIDRPAARIAAGEDGLLVLAGEADSFRRGHDPRLYEVEGEARYDAVLATVPNDVFTQLLDPALASRMAGGYLERLAEIEYQTALCLLLELDRRFSAYYWTNVADREIPFVGLIEQTNLIDPARYGRRRFMYVANYVAADDPILELDAQALLDRYEDGLRRVNPEFDQSWVRRSWLFREPAAQPTVTLGYRERIPPLETGVPGLMLANTTQIYPEDRGTNYSVRLGTEAAEAMTRSLPR